MQGESNSITNQKKILEDYAERNGFTNFRHFCDDGVSGTTFERKGFKEMIAEIENGNVGTVIVKDMSRLGRDYLQVGFYTEIFFRQKGVRFIAVSNNIDSDNGESSEFAPFLNIMAEWYARDTSRKQKATYQSKSSNGKRTTNGIIYGYFEDPNDKNKWVIDPVAADVGINTKGTMFLTQTVANQMLKQEIAGKKRGTIINVSSCSAEVSSTGRGEYCVSKAGMSMLTKLYADRLAGSGILVHEVRPGVISTDMTSSVQEKYDKLIAGGAFPIARWGTPEDIAEAVSAFAGDLFLYTTGNYIDVDGGFHIKRL